MTITDFKTTIVNPNKVEICKRIKTKDCSEEQFNLYQKIVNRVGQIFPIEVVMNNQRIELLSGRCLLNAAINLGWESVKCTCIEKEKALILMQNNSYQFKGKEKEMIITAYKTWKSLDKEIKKSLTRDMKGHFLKTMEAENNNYIPCYEFIRIIIENPYKSYSAIKQTLSSVRTKHKKPTDEINSKPISVDTIKPKSLKFASELNEFLHSHDAHNVSSQNIKLLNTLLSCLEQVETQFE